MRLIKLSLAAAVLAGTVVTAQASEIGVSANMAITSNYIWRGMTQSADSPAIQGGIDVDYMGVYAGVWGSNVEFGDARNSLEADAYIGYANEIAGLSYDVGFIAYMYPNMSDDYNFGELYVGLGYDFGVLSVGASYAMGVDISDSEDVPDNIEVSASVPLPMDISLDAAYGMYDTVGDYYSVSATKTLGKFDLSLAYTGFMHDTDDDSDQDAIVATIGTSF